MISRNTIQKNIDLVEYEDVLISKDELSFLNKKDLETTLYALNQLVTILPTWDDEHFHFKANSKVGALSIHGLRVQVRPRLSANEFCILIRYALSGQIPPEHFRSHTDLTWETGFEDALSTILCDEVNEIFRIGLSRRYEERREPLPMLRGRVLWEKNFPWRSGKAKEIFCRYHQLTYDNLDNRLLLFGIRSAAVLSLNWEVKSRINKHLKTFALIVSEKVPELSQFEQVKQGYNRLNEHYLTAHGLSKMLIYDLRPESFFEGGKNVVAGVVLDMPSLFEKFVERFMADLLGPTGIKLRPQTKDHRALLDLNGYRYASVRPDLEVWKGNKPVGVIDAKYKPYWKAVGESLKPDRKITNEDLYQLFFYQQRMKHKYNLLEVPVAVIASPLPDDDERNNHQCIPERFRRIFWQAGHERGGDVQLILIPMTRFLRLLNKRIAPSDSIAAIGFDRAAKLFH